MNRLFLLTCVEDEGTYKERPLKTAYFNNLEEIFDAIKDIDSVYNESKWLSFTITDCGEGED